MYAVTKVELAVSTPVAPKQAPIVAELRRIAHNCAELRRIAQNEILPPIGGGLAELRRIAQNCAELRRMVLEPQNRFSFSAPGGFSYCRSFALLAVDSQEKG